MRKEVEFERKWGVVELESIENDECLFVFPNIFPRRCSENCFSLQRDMLENSLQREMFVSLQRDPLETSLQREIFVSLQRESSGKFAAAGMLGIAAARCTVKLAAAGFLWLAAAKLSGFFAAARILLVAAARIVLMQYHLSYTLQSSGCLPRSAKFIVFSQTLSVWLL